MLGIGDQNIDVARLEDTSYYRYNLGKEYLNMIAENGLDTIEYGITWMKNEQIMSSIDHAFTNKILSVQSPRKILIDPKLSDHHLISLELNVNVPKKLQNGYTTFRDYRKMRANPGYFVAQLLKIDWTTMFAMEDIDDMEHFFTNEIKRCLDVCAPWKTKKIKNRRYKLPESVKIEVKKAQELLKKYNHNLENGIQDADLKTTMRKQYNYANSLVKKAGKKYNGQNITPDSSSKDIWKCINDILKPLLMAKNYMKLEKDGKVIEDPLVIAELFSEFFHEKPVKSCAFDATKEREFERK